MQFYSIGSATSFDYPYFTNTFLHTLEHFPNNIAGATLTFRARPNSNGSGNDKIALRFIDPDDGSMETVKYWEHYFGSIGWGSGTTQLGLSRNGTMLKIRSKPCSGG